MSATPTEVKGFKDYLTAERMTLGGAVLAATSLQAFGMFNMSFGMHNTLSNQLVALFSNLLNTVAGSFLSAGAQSMLANTFAIAAVAAVVAALAFACMKAFEFFTAKSATLPVEQTLEVQSNSLSA